MFDRKEKAVYKTIMTLAAPVADVLLLSRIAKEIIRHCRNQTVTLFGVEMEGNNVLRIHVALRRGIITPFKLPMLRKVSEAMADSIARELLQIYAGGDSDCIRQRGPQNYTTQYEIRRSAELCDDICCSYVS